MSWSRRFPKYLQRYIDTTSRDDLDEPQIRELVISARKGDRKARERLLASEMHRAWQTACTMEKKYSDPTLLAEDFFQAAIEGILQIIDEKFDLERGTRFASAAWWAVKNRCLEMAGDRHPVHAPRNAPICRVPLDIPPEPGLDGKTRPAVIDFVPVEEVDPEQTTVVTQVWPVIVLTLIEAVNAVNEPWRAAIIHRTMKDEGVTKVPHRTTLWKNEPKALKRVRDWLEFMLSDMMSDRVIVNVLRLIDRNVDLNGSKDSLALARAA
jgi:hypothetical protein